MGSHMHDAIEISSIFRLTQGNNTCITVT